MARRASKKKGSVKVSFKGVESRQTPAEGDYKFKVLEAVSGTSGNNNDQIEVTAEIVEGKHKGFKGYIYFPLQENSLWKLHAFLTALGMEVPDDDMDLDLSDLVDEEFVGVLTHETYHGRKYAKLTDFDSLENYKGSDDADEDEDEDKSKKKKGKKSKDDDAEDTGKKSKKDKKSKKSKDEDEDEKPSKKSKGKKDKGKKSKKVAKSDVEDMDEDELQALLEKHDLEDEVDLDDYKKLPKKVAAVIEALEEADLLEDDE
jgi:hypothetical protein